MPGGSFPAPEKRCASKSSGMPCRIEGMRNRRVPRSKEWCLGEKDWTDVNSDDCLEEWPITIVRNKYEYTSIPFPCHLNLVWNKNHMLLFYLCQYYTLDVNQIQRELLEELATRAPASSTHLSQAACNRLSRNDPRKFQSHLVSWKERIMLFLVTFSVFP